MRPRRFWEDREEGEFDPRALPPSKSQRKRDCQALQDIGEELCGLGPDTLAKIDLPEDLARAVADYKTLRTFGAKRRHMQLIGKLMRAYDGALVRRAIDRAKGDSQEAVDALHRAEALRAAMIAEDAAVTGFVAEFPEVDVAQLRRLVRQARSEAGSAKPPKAARELYKLIHAQILPPLEIRPIEDDEGLPSTD